MNFEKLPENLRRSLEDISFFTRIPSPDKEEVGLGCAVEIDGGEIINILDPRDVNSINNHLSDKQRVSLEEVVGLIVSEESPMARALIGGKQGEKKQVSIENGSGFSVEITGKIEASPLIPRGEQLAS